MDAKERILTIRLIEKSKKHKEFAKKILFINENKINQKKSGKNLFVKQK